MTHQEKRNRTLFITLIALSTITAVYYWYGGKERSVVDAGIFEVTDLKTIDRVLLETSGNKVDLTYDGTRWLVNREQADRDMLDVLFATLQQAKPLRPVARALQDSVKRILDAEGVKVSLFAEDKTELVFTAGGNARKTQAYFQREGSDEVYVMAIPGYRVYVSGIFEVEGTGWKDKYVFQLNWRNFQSLEARFPQSPADDFKVGFIDGFFSIEGMISVDTTKLNDFLDAVSLLTVDAYGNVSPVLEQSNPATLVIEVRDVGGKQYTLALYSTPEQTGPVNGIINGVQPAFFNRKKLDPILRRRDFFKSE